MGRPGGRAHYYAWDHPGDYHPQVFNEARGAIAAAISSGEELLFHNSKFDLAVMKQHLMIPAPAPHRVHDTLFLLALHDPYAQTYSLKPSAERILDLQPEEQNQLHDWIVEKFSCPRSEAGAYIGQAPADLVAPYACGDVGRTLALYERLAPKVPSAAYHRELQLRPILQESEERGIRVDVRKLSRDAKKYEKVLTQCAEKIYAALQQYTGASVAPFNIESGAELAKALDRAGLVGRWIETPTGQPSVARDNLLACITEPAVAQLLVYHGALSYCLSSFYRPWIALAQASRSGHRLHPEWNQVRQMRGSREDGVKGTRTGRLSCSNPNFQNPPNAYELGIPEGLSKLPDMRKYLLPEPDAQWGKRDYSQQELRILAHFTKGGLYRAYCDNPRSDAHTASQALIHRLTGKQFDRKKVKITGFSLIYGSGVAGLARLLGGTEEEAAELRTAYLEAFPEVRELMAKCQLKGRAQAGVETWGGRKYKSEPSALVKRVEEVVNFNTKEKSLQTVERMQDFHYKLINYLIQGSAADCTKEAIIRWNENKGSGQFLCTVHDEINVSVQKGSNDMLRLKEAMESIEFDVPMLTDGFIGENWQQLKECE